MYICMDEYVNRRIQSDDGAIPLFARNNIFWVSERMACERSEARIERCASAVSEVLPEVFLYSIPELIPELFPEPILE